MFNLIAQYIGYGEDNAMDHNDCQDPKFGVVEEGDWTLIDVANIEDIASKRRNTAEDDYQCVDTPEQLNNVEWPMTESVIAGATPQQVTVPSVDTRIRCAKSKKNQRVTAKYFTQYRPNQMKRCNQVFCQRGSKANQKMRQIVHQPRKF